VDIPPPPAGFTLDAPQQNIPPPPPGFTLDSAPSPAVESDQTQIGAGDVIKNAYGGYWEPVLAVGSSMVATPAAGLAGLGAAGLKAAGVTDAEPGEVVERVSSALTYQPRTAAGQRGVDVLSYPFRKLAEAGEAVGSGLASNEDPNANIVRRPDRANIPRRMEGSPAAGALANTAVQSLPALLLKSRAKSGGVDGDVPRPSPLGRSALPAQAQGAPAAAAKRPTGLGAISGEVPSKEALKKASQAAYKRAEDAGVIIRPESFGRAKQVISDLLEKEGIDPTLHPSTTAALKRISETEGPVTLQKLETLRRIAKDAEGAMAPADKRLAVKIVDTIDKYAETLGTKDISAGNPAAVSALKEARNLWSRARKADVIDDIMERAELSAPNFSASGMENAIRTEFRSLAKNERKMRMFNAEERAAIKRVAKGGPIENTLRMLGKFAPTGVVSTAGSIGAGLMTAGPVGAVALPVGGAVARYGASKMTLRNAQRAQELMRRGPLPKPPADKTPRNALREATVKRD
jgi:hypothetical protein